MTIIVALQSLTCKILELYAATWQVLDWPKQCLITSRRSQKLYIVLFEAAQKITEMCRANASSLYWGRGAQDKQVKSQVECPKVGRPCQRVC